MQTTITFDLNIVPGGIAPVVHVKQYDTGARRLKAIIYDDTGTTDLSDVYDVEISMKRANGSTVLLSKNTDGICAIDTANSVVTFDLTEAMTAVAGAAKAEIIFYSEDARRVASATFVLAVERAVNSADDVSGDSSFTGVVTTAVAQVLLEQGLVDPNRLKTWQTIVSVTGPDNTSLWLDLDGNGVIDNSDQIRLAQIAAGDTPSADELRAIDLYGDGSFSTRNQAECQRLMELITVSSYMLVVAKNTITYTDGTSEIKFCCIAPSAEVVRSDMVQTLTDAKKATARENIGAASESNLTDIAAAINSTNSAIFANAVSRGVPAAITEAVGGHAEVTTTADTVLRYKENLITLSEPTPTVSGPAMGIDENGAWTINGSRDANMAYTIQTVPLTGGVTYRIDGGPRESASGFCYLRVKWDDEYQVNDLDGKGRRFTPSHDVNADIVMRIYGGVEYNNVKFRPILSVADECERVSPDELTLLSGDNEVLGLDFAPVEVRYYKNDMKARFNTINTEIEDLSEAIDGLIDEDAGKIDLSPYADGSGRYTESFAFTLNLKNNPTVLSMTSQYTGDAPTVQITVQSGSGSVVLREPYYILGGTREPTRRSWRLPAKSGAAEKAVVSVSVPSGTTVTIRDAVLRSDQRARYADAGIKFHGHAGYIAPGNTAEAFRIGAELGFNTMITIPKFTSDGVGICFHDDDKISGALCRMDGTSITGSDDKAISLYTYDEITSQFRMKSTSWGVLHVPTLDEYFRICSMTGMAPILSIHPAEMFYNERGLANFAKIKEMTDRYRLTHKLWIKSGNPYVQSAALSVFGTELAGMVLLRGQSSTWDPLEQAKRITDTQGSRLIPADATDAKQAVLPLVFEMFYGSADDESIRTAISEGFDVGVATTGTYGISGAEMERLIGLGVTEFTVDHHISVGLAW